jgi:hypothetical protein
VTSEARRPIEDELLALGHELDDALPERDLSIAVRAAITVPRRRVRARTSMRVRIAAVAAAIVTAVALTPTARAAIVDFFHFGAEDIRHEPPPTQPGPVVGSELATLLGPRTTLAGARDHMPVVVPGAAGFTRPDDVRYAPDGNGHTTLVYRARRGLRAAPGTGVGLLVEEFAGDGTTLVTKYVQGMTRAEPVTVDGNPAVFVSGAPHPVFYDTPDGRGVTFAGRLAGNALIMQRGPLTIRLEAELPRAEMVRIAASLH